MASRLHRTDLHAFRAKRTLRLERNFRLIGLLFASCLAQTQTAALAEPPANSPPTSAITATSAATDWAEFLGPLQTGVAPQPPLLSETWPAEGLPVRWSLRVGEGYSAPSIRGTRLVLHHRVRSDDVVECFSTSDGQSQWKYTSPTTFVDPFGYSGGPRATPLLTETDCFTFGPQGRLTCLDLATGKRRWERETAADWKVPEHFFGAGCTPVLADGKLIVLVGGQPDSAVVAFDPATGNTLWEAAGRTTWDGAATGERGERATYRWTGEEMLVSYSTPLVATIDGQTHLLCLLRQGLVSLDPATGAERFHFWFRSKLHESVNAARPVVVGRQILICAAYDAGSVLLEVAPDGRSVAPVWRQKTLDCHWSTPIYIDGHFFGFGGRHKQGAMLQCVNARTGELVWETTGWEQPLDDFEQDQRTGEIRSRSTQRVVPFPYYGRGSKIQVGPYFIVLGEDGNLALVQARTDRFVELARMKVPELRAPTWTAPILSGSTLYLRDDRRLIALELPVENQTPPAGTGAP